ncbi:MAG: serine hydrolase [Desulfomonile tiedjei]|nr:serine hydrolase [Desulfomonile tiedjei]
MFYRTIPAILAILIFAPSYAAAFEPARWSGSVQDIAARIGKPQYDTLQRQPKVSVVTKNKNATPRPAVARAVESPHAGEGSTAQVRRGAARAETEVSSLKPRPLLASMKAALPVDRHERPSAPPRGTGSALAAKRSMPKPPAAEAKGKPAASGPNIPAKAMYCLDCAADKVILAKNISEPLPIASITKLLTAMVVLDEMKLDQIVEVPEDIVEVPPHKVGIRPRDLFTVNDLLHGMLMESGNDCAEALACAYPKGGRAAFLKAMNRKATSLGASSTALFTPSGLDMKVILGRRDGKALEATKPNVASAKDVALIARHAFNYPLISEITSTKTCTVTTRNDIPRKYRLASNIKLLYGNLPIVGAKTGFTNMAGRCIVAHFKDDAKDQLVVVLNTRRHFKAAENIYRWAAGKKF